MKQHITASQLDELSKKGIKNLKKYLLPKNIPGFWDVNFVPTLSIGQMIEFLDEENVAIDITTGWTIIASELQDLHTYKNEELCDALWEAVKEILEK